jgi:hypothetical protein
VRDKYNTADNHRADRADQHSPGGGVFGDLSVGVVLAGRHIDSRLDRGVDALGEEHQRDRQHKRQPLPAGQAQEAAQRHCAGPDQAVNLHVALGAQHIPDAAKGIPEADKKLAKAIVRDALVMLPPTSTMSGFCSIIWRLMGRRLMSHKIVWSSIGHYVEPSSSSDCSRIIRLVSRQ